MDDTSNPQEQITVQDLDYIEQAAIRNIMTWLKGNPNVRWTATPPFSVKYCANFDACYLRLPFLTKDPYYYGQIYHIQQRTLVTNQPGIVIPLFHSKGGEIEDQGIRYKLEPGKKFIMTSLSRTIKLSTNDDKGMYVFWQLPDRQ